MRNILKDAQAKSAISKEKPYRLADGEGLCLLINKITKDEKQGVVKDYQMPANEQRLTD